MSWMDDAACLGEDPELFFPDGPAKEVVLKGQLAKAVCRRCDVIGQCLSWAIETDQEIGIWGGLNLHERRHHKRRLAQSQRRSPAA
jgi:WhiB family transcriptional regulator, redox-sensing transcriptional regulator